MTLQPGTVIGGRYRLTEPIAVGGMGAVWRAEDTTLGRDVAVKLLKREFTGDPTFLARFRAEDPERRVILPHEHTRAAAKEDRWRVLNATKANFSPRSLQACSMMARLRPRVS